MEGEQTQLNWKERRLGAKGTMRVYTQELARVELVGVEIYGVGERRLSSFEPIDDIIMMEMTG